MRTLAITLSLIALQTAPLAAQPSPRTPTLTGTYDVTFDQNPNVRTAISIQSAGHDITLQGIGQNWTGRGRVDGTGGYYDWQFPDGKAGHNTITINPDGSFRAHVQSAASPDQWFTARPVATMQPVPYAGGSYAGGSYAGGAPPFNRPPQHRTLSNNESGKSHGRLFLHRSHGTTATIGVDGGAAMRGLRQGMGAVRHALWHGEVDERVHDEEQRAGVQSERAGRLPA